VGPLTVAVGYDLSTLDPHAQNSFEALEQLTNVYDTLVALGPDLRLMPSLAVSWSNPDSTTWSFRLRPGVRFHDGSPLTAADVVHTIKRLKGDESLAARSQLSDVTGAVVEGDEVVIRTSRPSARLLHELTQVAIVQDGATRESLDSRANGTGPFRVESFTPRRRLGLARHEAYWGAPPRVPRVDVLLGVSDADAAAGIRDERLSLVAHLASGDGREALEAAARRPRYRLVRQPSLFVRHLGFNVASPVVPGTRAENPFRRLEVRRAVDLALDRAAIARAVSAHAVPAEEIVSNLVFGYEPTPGAAAPDPDGARRLLEAAGYARGLDVTLHLPRDADPASDELAAQLGRVGIRVTVATVPSTSDFFGALRRREFAFWAVSDGAMTGEAGGLLAAAFHSPDRARRLGLENYGGLADVELDRLIEEADASFDPTLRLRILQAALRRAGEQAVWIPLYRRDAPFIVARRLAFAARGDLLIRYAEIAPGS